MSSTNVTLPPVREGDVPVEVVFCPSAAQAKAFEAFVEECGEDRVAVVRSIGNDAVQYHCPLCGARPGVHCDIRSGFPSHWLRMAACHATRQELRQGGLI